MGFLTQTNARQMSRAVALGATLVIAMAGSTMAALEKGELPVTGFSYTTLVDDIVRPTDGRMPTPDTLADVYAWVAGAGSAERGRMPTPDTLADVYAWVAGAGSAERGASSSVAADLGLPGPMAVKTTYTLEPADPEYRLGWHHINGPVIFTVTTGTLTVVDDSCQTFDLVAGRSYIESAGQVLDAVLLPDKNPGGAAVGWFTTRLYPEGAADSVEVDAPSCDVT